MKDFSRDRKQIQFKIDDDVFHCRPALAADVLLDFTERFSAIKEDDGAESRAVLVSVLEEVLQPDSFARFRERMADRDNPVDMPQANAVIEWVFEEYGLRPTQPSSGSPNGQPGPESGMNSMESVPAVVSISVDSPSTDS
jgi:hypothetical protein